MANKRNSFTMAKATTYSTQGIDFSPGNCGVERAARQGAEKGFLQGACFTCMNRNAHPNVLKFDNRRIESRHQGWVPFNGS